MPHHTSCVEYMFVCLCPVPIEARRCWIPGTGVRDVSCRLGVETEFPHLLEKQLVLLTAEPSFQLLECVCFLRQFLCVALAS